MSFTTDTARWRALTIRDATANGQFVYTVKSTNIYCRPTCPARLARRANVGFYKTSTEAEAAGFRACKRCKPEIEVNEDPQERAVAKACNLIEKALKENNPKSFRLQDLAKNVGLTPRYFHKIFKDKTGLTPKEYAKVKRTEYSTSGTISPENEIELGAEPFNFDEFDFNDLVNFETDPNLQFNSGFTFETPGHLLPTAGLGTDIDVNIPVEPWFGTYSPNSLESESDSASDIRQESFDAASYSVTRQFGGPMTTAVSTVEMDAAIILSADGLSDFLLGLNTENQEALLKMKEH